MFQKMKLSAKLAVIIAGVLAIILIILSICSITMSQSAIRKGISGELTSIANGNANIIEQNFRVLENAAEGIQGYLDQQYPSMMQNISNKDVSTLDENTGDTENAVNTEILPSILYPNHAFSTNTHDVESFMIETCRSAISANDGISAMGIMFEPYKFHDDMEAFGFWIDQSNLEATDIAFTNYTDYAQEDSYRYVIEKKQAYISLPYQNGSGHMVVAYGIPIVYNNEVIGVVIANLYLDAFSSVTTSSENYPSMWITIYNDAGNIIWDSETLDDVGKNMQEFTPNQKEYEQIQTMMASKSDFHMEKTREDGKGVSCFYSPIQVGDYTWWSLTGLYSSDAHQSMVQTTVWLCVLSIIALIVVVLVVILVLRRMLAPVKYVVQAAETIAAGNLDIQIQTNRQDEIGDLYRSFQIMAENLKAIIKDVDYLLNEMANGNFDIHTDVEENYVGDYKGILLAIHRINRSLSETLSQINQAANQVSLSSDQVSSGAQALSQGATEQASSVEQLAATITEISETVQKNAKMAEDANTNVNQVNHNVAESGEKMKTTLDIMEDARAQTTKVQGIIKTIEDIAFQTNILALNAAVEAARAGAAGKGFAVVADEVRNLASKSAEASKNTTDLINSALSAIAEGAQSMQETKQFVDNVVVEVEEITKVFEKISLASDQQASSIAQVTIGIDQISSVVQTNSATAEESAAASQELSGQADLLKELISKFQLRTILEEDTAKSSFSDTYDNHIGTDMDMRTTSSKY